MPGRARTNTLIITDLPSGSTTATDLIDTLDRAQPQVEIEARIVQTNKDYARALGVQWGFNGRVDPALGNTTNLAFPNSGNLGGRVGDDAAAGRGRATGRQQPTAVNLAASGASERHRPGARVGQRRVQPRRRAVGARNERQRPAAVDAARHDAEQRRGRNRRRACRFPIQTVANNTVTVKFKDAALTLQSDAADHRGRTP